MFISQFVKKVIASLLNLFYVRLERKIDVGVFENNLKICIHELFLIKNDFHISYQHLFASTQKERKEKLKLCKRKGYQWEVFVWKRDNF